MHYDASNSIKQFYCLIFSILISNLRKTKALNIVVHLSYFRLGIAVKISITHCYTSILHNNTKIIHLWKTRNFHIFMFLRKCWRTRPFGFFKRLAYTLTAFCCRSKWHNRMLRQSATYGTKYRVRQIVHKTTRTDINSRTLQAAVIV